MRDRWILVLALAATAVTAGCVGVLDDEPTQSASEDAASSTTRQVQIALGSPPPGERAQSTREVSVPEGATGLFATYEASVEEPGDVDVDLEMPDGDKVDLASVSASTGTSTTNGTALLEPVAGTWKLVAEASQGATVALHLTVQTEDANPTPVEPTGPSRVVVAVVDTGVNPYHEVFQREELATQDLPARIAQASNDEPPLSVPVEREESYRASLRQNANAWASVPDERLVHFENTNLLGYQLGDTTLPTAPVLDQSGHGTAVAHSATRENPEGLVVAINAPDYDAGVAWAAQQPWIDLISLSWGPVVNAAGVAEPQATGFTTPEVTRQAHANGKLVFTATGNDPTPAFTDTTSGPPWVHAVSGAEPDTQSRALRSGNLIDTVANWTQDLAHYRSLDETGTASGTSFATPTTAGIASRILHEVRQQAGHEGGIADGNLVDTANVTVANSDLRHALNRSAVYWSTTDYGGPTDPGPSVPVAPTPWASMGWGYLDGSRVEPAVNGLLGIEDLPSKSDAAKAWMAKHQALREDYWQTK